MTELLQVYKCKICGNIVEVLHAGRGTLVCCGQAMQLQEEQTADYSTEKHVPVVEETATGIRVTVGSTLHPMESNHWIEWIQVIVDGKSYRQFLEPGVKPEAEFEIKGKEIIAREYCNIHGLWKTS